MQINGPTQIHGPQPLGAPHRVRNSQAPAPNGGTSGADQLDISREADLVSRIHEIPDIRVDRVAELRAAIESGTYETPDKLNVALDRLLDEIGV